MSSTDEFISLAEERLLSSSLEFKLGIHINSEVVLWFFGLFFFFELIYPTLYGESPLNIYVLLSDEHYVLIQHHTKKSDASHPHL